MVFRWKSSPDISEGSLFFPLFPSPSAFFSSPLYFPIYKTFKKYDRYTGTPGGPETRRESLKNGGRKKGRKNRFSLPFEICRAMWRLKVKGRHFISSWGNFAVFRRKLFIIQENDWKICRRFFPARNPHTKVYRIKIEFVFLYIFLFLYIFFFLLGIFFQMEVMKKWIQDS